MAGFSCLAGIDDRKIGILTSVLEKAGAPRLAVIASVNIGEFAGAKPDIMVCDIDHVATDPLELLRQMRFVLPACIIVVYTARMQRAWSIACHLAGANALILHDSTEVQLVSGIRSALRTGSFTDPRFAAA